MIYLLFINVFMYLSIYLLVFLFIYLFIYLLKACSPVNRTGSPQGFYYTGGRIYINLSGSIQSAAGLKVKAFEACCQWANQSLPYYLHLLYRSMFVLLVGI